MSPKVASLFPGAGDSDVGSIAASSPRKRLFVFSGGLSEFVTGTDVKDALSV